MAFVVTFKQIKIKWFSELQQTVPVFYDFDTCLAYVVLKLMAFGKLFQVLQARVISLSVYVY